MTKKLAMVFTLSTGKSLTVTLADPKADLTKSAVETVMNEIIAKQVFVNKTGTLAAIKGVNISTTESVALA